MSEVAYGASSNVPGVQRLRSQWSVDETIEKIKQRLERANVMLIAEIDPQKVLLSDGRHIRPARQLFFFHPRYMQALLEADPAAIVAAPLKVVVLEEPSSEVWVLCPEPEALLAPYARTRQLAATLTELVQTILQAVAAPP